MFGKAVFFVLLSLLVPRTARGQDPVPKADDANAKKVKVLIEKLAGVSEPGMGYSGSVTGSMFLPLDTRGQIHTALLGQRPLQRSDAMKELVSLGATAVPHLIDHLDDRRPTRIPPLVHDGFFGGMWFSDAIDFNERVQKAPAERKAAKQTERRPVQFHRLTVGDLCFVAIGQIVNRNFNAVRYQPTAIIVVASPTRSDALRAAVKEHWGGLTPEKHRALLLEDFDKADSEYRRTGAAKRLAYYYPEALVGPAQRLLSRPTFDVFDVEAFARKKLYPARGAKERKKLFEDYIAAKGEPYREGLLLQLWGDLTLHEADATTCLTELYGKKGPFDWRDRPPHTEALSSAEQARLIRDGLIHDTSTSLDRAVLNLLAAIKDDDYLALACMERLVGRGYDAEIERYCRGRPANKEPSTMLARVGWTPVHVAVARGNAEELTNLLRKSASPAVAARSGDTPMHLAAKSGDVLIVKELLNAKAPADVKNRDGRSPAHLAAAEEHWEVVRLLVDGGAAVPDVLVAAALGDSDRVKAFVDTDAMSVGRKSASAKTALHLAAANGHVRIVEALLAAKSSVDAADADGMSPLHLACVHGHEAATRLLIARKADVRKLTRYGDLRPLHLASFAGKAEIVALLLDSGAEINASAGRGRTALHLAASQGHPGVIELLLKRGAMVDQADDDNLTPLHVAAEAGQSRAAEALLVGKADVQARAGGDQTPLHLAVKGGHRDTAALLLRHKADPGAKAFFGTPLQIGESIGETETLELLRKASRK